MPIKQFLIERCLPVVALAAIMPAAFVISGCGEQQGPQDSTEYYGQPQHAEVEDPIGFTAQNYDFTGETPIADIHAMFDTSEQVWYGLSPMDPFPMGDERALDVECGDFGNEVAKVEDLPATIEGVATLHPRYFQKISVCGQDQRYYGSFFLQDETDGILVLQDYRVTDFTFGQRVRLRVRGLVTSFGQPAVLISDQLEVVEDREVQDIYYEKIERPFETADASKVRRIEGVVISEPTNANFNELILEGDEGSVWGVSIDRELGNRGVNLHDGDRIQLTGPVINSYGLNMLIASLGQIERLDSAE
jgi:hypothetical protein